jgi:hypothetical protein
MSTLENAINDCFRKNNTKTSMSLRAVKEQVNEALKTSHSQQVVQEELKRMGCDLFKSSVTNPHYSVQPPARLSSKSKPVTIPPQAASEQDQEQASQAALLIV